MFQDVFMGLPHHLARLRAWRTGSVTVANKAFTVSQPGVPCSYSISPASQSFASGAAAGSVGVTAGTCSWTARACNSAGCSAYSLRRGSPSRREGPSRRRCYLAGRQARSPGTAPQVYEVRLGPRLLGGLCSGYPQLQVARQSVGA